MKRDAAKVLSKLKTLENGVTVATAPITIQFPTRFQEIDLAVIGDHSYVYGLFAIISEDSYALLNLNCYVELGKARIEKKVIGAYDYYCYNYEAGDRVILTNEAVSRTNLIFLAINNFIFMGKIPWYVTYDDLGHIFDTASSHAKTKARIPPVVAQFLAGYVSRSKSDRTKFIRETIQKREDATPDKISYVPMRSVFWSAPGIVNKLSGAYFNDGVVSALNNPSKRVETIESILK